MTEKDRIIINTEEIEGEDEIFEMSNVIGDFMKVPHKMNFSFYFSDKDKNKHGIRVKVSFRPNRMKRSMAGILVLHGDWEFYKNVKDEHVSSKDIKEMKKFFKDYKVLFAGVWEERIEERLVQKYFEGDMSLMELIKGMDDYEEYKNELDKVNSIKELEQTVRKYNIFNMHD